MPDPTPGEVAYAAWLASLLGPHAPTGYAGWSVLHHNQQAAWEAAAQAVLMEGHRHAHAVVRHWHEFGPARGFDETLYALETWLKPRGAAGGN